MPPKNPRKAAARRRARKEEQGSDIEDELPPEKPPRPFREVNDLPMSLDPPEYNILSQPLSIKDSAVLYSSLMKSRKAFTASNVFDLYWAKGKTKFDNDVNARDKMNKLCDCGMEIGPHTYDVRFFILKDDEIEKKREEIKSKKKEKRMANKQMREERKKARENEPQGIENPGATPEGKPSNGLDSSGQPAASTTVKNDGDDDSDDSDTDNEVEASTMNPSQPVPSTEANSSRTLASTPAASTPSASTPAASAPAPELDQTPSQPPVANAPQPTPTQSEAPKEQQKPTDHPKPKSLPLIHSSSVQSQSSELPRSAASTPAAPAASAPGPTPAPPPQSANDMMQTPESQMMIANLNAIARADPSLNALMKIVASGAASSAQIREFQGYIQRAKSMGPPPFFRQQFPNYQPEVRPVRPPKPPKAPKPPRERQLTTFQEMYVNGAHLVFEFSENPNVRYSLPKNCIVEKSDNGDFIISYLAIYNEEKINKWKAREEARKQKAEKAKAAEENKKLQMEANLKKKKEEEEKKKLDDEKRKIEEAKLEKRSSRRRSAKKRDDDDIEMTDTQVKEEQSFQKEEGKTKQQQQQKKQEKKDEDPEPAPFFMPISFKITGMDSKYDPIMLNSFTKHDDVYKYMEKVLKEGDRAPKFLLWYQVDAYDDEKLSENLREQLYLIENPPKKYKRRNTEENPLIAKPKRQRKEKKIEAQAAPMEPGSVEGTAAA